MSPSIRDDYILRLIRDSAQAVARIFRLRTSGQPEAAQKVLDSAYRGLVGPNADLFSRLDAADGARLLADPGKMAVMSDLLHEEAETLRAAGGGDGLGEDLKALLYALEAAALEPNDEDIRSRVRLRAQAVRPEALDPGYRDMLSKMHAVTGETPASE
jgi:hypothetical protein